MELIEINEETPNILIYQKQMLKSMRHNANLQHTTLDASERDKNKPLNYCSYSVFCSIPLHFPHFCDGIIDKVIMML